MTSALQRVKIPLDPGQRVQMALHSVKLRATELWVQQRGVQQREEVFQSELQSGCLTAL
jgi:hypothetical protein